MKTVMVSLLATILIVAVVAMLKPDLLQGVISVFRETPTPAPPTKPNVEEQKRAIRQVLQGVLPEDDPHLKPAVPLANLQWTATEASKAARERMKELRRLLERNQGEPRGQYPIIQSYCKQWDKFSLPGPTDDPPANLPLFTNKPLDVLRCYTECAKRMSDLAKSSDDEVTGKRFADGVRDLIDRLKKAED